MHDSGREGVTSDVCGWRLCVCVCVCVCMCVCMCVCVCCKVYTDSVIGVQQDWI